MDIYAGIHEIHSEYELVKTPLLTTVSKILLTSLIFSYLLYAGSAAHAQNNGESQNSNSLAMLNEIIDKLNKDAFKNAIVGVANKGTESDLEIFATPYQEAYVSRGFILDRYNDCTLTLRNDEGLVLYSFLADHPNFKSTHSFLYTAQIQKTPLSIELVIPLYELSYKKGRKNYRLKTKPERAAIYGKWRVQLKARSGSLPIVLKATRNGEKESLKGEILTFTFDDEGLSREFDTSFRSAIRLCQSYKPPKADKPNPWVWKN